MASREKTQQRAAIYCRVSSEQQEDNASLPTQEASCRAYASEHGYDVQEVHVYREVHTGAELFERPEMSRLREAIRNRSVDVVIAHALDRLTRKQIHQGLLLSEADHAGVRLEFVTEQLEDTPEGRLLLSVRSFTAEIERIKIAERTQRGKRARVAAGKYNVGCRAPFGYAWADPTTKASLVEHPTNAEVVRRIFEGLANGISARQLSIAFTRESIPTPSGRAKAWYWSAILSIVGNPIYWGEARAYRSTQTHEKGRGKVTRRRPIEEQVPMPGVAPALVSPELAAAAKTRLARNKSESVRNNKEPKASLLRAGFARCGYCGNVLEVQHARGGWMYRCSTYHRDQHGCPYFSIMAHILDAAVWGQVEYVLQRPEVIRAEVARIGAADPVDRDLASIERKLAELGRMRSNLARRLAGVDDDALADPIMAELQSLTTQVASLEQRRTEALAVRAAWQGSQSRLDDLEHWVALTARNLQGLDYEHKREALRALNVQTTVWATDHAPRFEISMEPEGLLPASALSGLPKTSGAGHAEERVDDGIPRNTVKKTGRLVLRWTDRDLLAGRDSTAASPGDEVDTTATPDTAT
jgi:site-specific DNA recombinase